jgi:mono/diheme cytochrome c family protein
MLPRTRIVPAAVAAIAVMATGCGGEKPGPTPAETATGGAVVAGKAVFIEQKCGSCHTLGAAGTHGTVGPNLAEGLAGKTRQYTRQSIVDPNASITSGYPPNTMPKDYGKKLSAEQLDALVDFLAESTVTKRGD